MKKILPLIVVAVLATSCGAQKKALESQNALLQQQVALQQQTMDQQRAEAEAQKQQIAQQQAEQQQLLAEQEAAQKVRPTRELREAEPCEELSLEKSDNLREFGTAIANIEKVARNEALRDARNKLAQSIQIAVEGAARDYDQNANADIKVATETLAEAVNTQYVAQYIANSRAVKWSVYDLSDGGIQVYVCVEMEKAKEAMLRELENKLEEDGVMAIKADRDRFVGQIGDNIEKSKEEQRAQLIQQ